MGPLFEGIVTRASAAKSARTLSSSLTTMGTCRAEVTYPDVYAEWSVNEKVSLEVAFGAAMAGSRSFCGMKHVGMNVASDALMTMTLTGVAGGLVIAIADDVGLSSSQNEQDSRYWGRFAHVPVLEPADGLLDVALGDLVAAGRPAVARHDDPVGMAQRHDGGGLRTQHGGRDEVHRVLFACKAQLPGPLCDTGVQQRLQQSSGLLKLLCGRLWVIMNDFLHTGADGRREERPRRRPPPRPNIKNSL